ncbi:HAD-IB family phosphatase [Paludibaculum fermentans]|uniref:HAD-IB family phosphatase n=1 Tax=Paludibaculum fermentans TaxID=1473598 RepID=A0A7S7SHV4_PALFE|nr:HAD-IB family phosphatase [Paludibaculum fermentans]QOY86332.1 HAD-IB family phosphatase [Paludibaculum fermentans]
MPSSVLITDFDGTISRLDFYELALPHCSKGSVPDFWQGYSTGRLTHFEAMAGIFGQIRCSEAELQALLPLMEVDPGLPAAVAQLHDSGWDVVIVSNGSNWYIDQLLSGLGLGHLEVHSNPGHYVEGSGLVLQPPVGSPFYSPEYGIDKSAVVRTALKHYDRVAFAGNGPPDEKPALLVDAELRFATGWLANNLKRSGVSFHPFRRWSEIARFLSGEAPRP